MTRGRGGHLGDVAGWTVLVACGLWAAALGPLNLMAQAPSPATNQAAPNPVAAATNAPAQTNPPPAAPAASPAPAAVPVAPTNAPPITNAPAITNAPVVTNAVTVTNAPGAANAPPATNAPPPPPPPSPQELEHRAYNAATKMFLDGLYEAAERECGQFVQLYTNSERVAGIILLQGQARLKLKRYEDAAALLKEKAGLAGKLGDEFCFWQAEARFQKGDWAAAADLYAQLVAQFTNSAHRLEASCSEAYARFKLGDTARTVAVLQDPNGAFQQAAKGKPDDPGVLRSWFLLGEGLFLKKEMKAAEEALSHLADRRVEPEMDWKRHFMLARIQFSDQRFPEALSHTTNLWSSLTNTLSRELLAEAAAMQGELLERLRQPDAALQTYERNLAEGIPLAYRRSALLRTIEINLNLGRHKETARQMEAFINQRPGDENLDLARHTVGELRLKDYIVLKNGPDAAKPENQATLTNLLTQARAQFEFIITNYPRSLLVGKAHLNRGWCLWEERPNRLADSQQAFKAAAERLPVSAEQATAYCKWADCQFESRDFGGAMTNYWLVATNYSATPGVTNDLIVRALYQIVRAGIEAGEVSAAAAALTPLLAKDTAGGSADHAQLLLGQACVRETKWEMARGFFNDLVKRFPNSPLAPLAKLTAAGTFDREKNWPAAIGEYAAWLGTYTNQEAVAAGWTAQAAFAHARLSYQLKPDTNAVSLLTSFAARFPDSTNAPLAQYLVGEYYFGQGDYEKAELHLQDKLLFLNTNALATGLAFQARLMAARAAVAGQRYRSARDYLDWLITNGPLYTAVSPIPVSVVAQAYLFRGDAFFNDRTETNVTVFVRYGEAMTAFSKVTEHFATNEFAPYAWGRIGDCHLQLAAEDPALAAKRYESAAEAYKRVVDSPGEVALRSLAEIGLATALKNQARFRPAAEQRSFLDRALDHYLRVFYQKNLRPGESPDLATVRQAGLAAAELAESQQKWDEALGIYRRLQAELPQLRERMEKKILQALQAKEKAAGTK